MKDVGAVKVADGLNPAESEIFSIHEGTERRGETRQPLIYANTGPAEGEEAENKRFLLN